MAFVNCPECNREISEKAICCPHCGYPLHQQYTSEKIEADADMALRTSASDLEAESVNKTEDEKTDCDQKECETASAPQITNNPSYQADAADAPLPAQDKGRRQGKKHILIPVLLLGIAVCAGIVVYHFHFSPKAFYRKGEKSYLEQEYKKAADYFQKAGSYSDAEDRLNRSVNAAHYKSAVEYMAAGDYHAAVAEFPLARGFEDSEMKLEECVYNIVAGVWIGERGSFLSIKSRNKADYYRQEWNFVDDADWRYLDGRVIVTSKEAGCDLYADVVGDADSLCFKSDDKNEIDEIFTKDSISPTPKSVKDIRRYITKKTGVTLAKPTTGKGAANYMTLGGWNSRFLDTMHLLKAVNPRKKMELRIILSYLLMT